MDAILEMMRGWEPVGQGMFLVFLVLVAVSILGGVGTFFTVLIRGYPNKGSDGDAE